ncbi:MAG: hypothetical protein SVR08_17490 [Spirochaetota bacterium]|nr:hypothetical protein [Spirochaetota bacterium]
MSRRSLYQIVQSITIINELTQSNASGSEQISANSKKILGLAEFLQ